MVVLVYRFSSEQVTVVHVGFWWQLDVAWGFGELVVESRG